jgi:hypothetical protein
MWATRVACTQTTQAPCAQVLRKTLWNAKRGDIYVAQMLPAAVAAAVGAQQFTSSSPVSATKKEPEEKSRVLCRPQTSSMQQYGSVFPNLGAMSPAASQKPSADGGRAPPPVLEQHPDFPRLPATAPLTYHLAMQVCLASRPQDRLAFSQISRLLHCLLKEVASGVYTDTRGQLQVCVHAHNSSSVTIARMRLLWEATEVL